MSKQTKQQIERFKLDKKFVDSLKAGPNKYIHFDSDDIGFLIQVYPSGAKSFAVNYRDKYNRLKRYTIGRYPAVTVQQARKRARELLAGIMINDADPAAERLANRDALTVADIVARYFESAKFAEKAASTQYTDRSKLNNHILPTLGNVIAKELTPDAVRKARKDIAAGRTASTKKTAAKRGVSRARGGEGAARNVMRVFRAAMNWALTEGLIEENPVLKLGSLGSDGTRDDALQSAAQYKALFEALEHLQSTLQISPAAANAIRVLALTGARKNEIAAARWRYLDLSQSMLTLPPGGHKTGHGSNGKAKHIPLPSAAAAIFASMEAGGPDDYIFSTDGGATFVELGTKVWAKIRKQPGIHPQATNHMLRHSLGTMLAIQGAEAAQIMAALGHSQLSTTQRYINIAQSARAQILEHHTAGIAAALAGDTSPAEVVPLRVVAGKEA